MKVTIYKITSPNTDKVYIGSTVRELKYRMSQHMSNFNNKDKYKVCRSFAIIECGDAIIDMIKEIEGNH
jgi:hypothetical protein